MDILKIIEFSTEENLQIIDLISKIERFQGKWEALSLSDNEFMKQLRMIATIQSIGSSTRIEGSKLSNNEVKELLNNLEINELKTRDEQEVIGYWKTLQLILDNADDIEISERYIFQLHSLLLKYSDKDLSQKGKYKSITNKVVATYPNGSQKTIFRTTEPHLVPIEMQNIIKWTNSEFKKYRINPLIIIATFIYEFLSIHPFHDGNGRLSRLLTTLLLVKEKYFFVQYVSFEHVIEERKKEYYRVLMECQSKRYSNEERIGSWIFFFLECLLILSKKLENKLEGINHKDIYLNQRQRKILTLLNRMGKLRINDIVLEFSDISKSSLKKDLKYLCDNSLIDKEGTGKATTYLNKNIII